MSYFQRCRGETSCKHPSPYSDVLHLKLKQRTRCHAVPLICKSKQYLCLLRHTLPLDFVQYFSPNCSVTQSKRRLTEPLCHHTYWSLLAVGLMSEVTACIKSCPALYNSSAALNMSHLATLRCGWHLYWKDVMACLPETRAKAKDQSKAKAQGSLGKQKEKLAWRSPRGRSKNRWERSTQ